MIKTHELEKSFDGFKALDSVNIHVKKGTVYGLVGPNGAGKTTLIKTLIGAYKKDSGQVLVNGSEVYENNHVKNKISYIADELYFYPNYRIIDMAKFYSSIYPTWSWDRFDSLTKVFDMDINRKVNKMSKGMKKQVAFWLAISSRTDIMVLDEPVDGLDPITRKKVWSLVMQDVAEYETTVLVSSHNLRELEDVCDHVGIMHKGKLILEKELDDAKSSVHKIQVAFKEDIPEHIFENSDILYKNTLGSVHTLIMRGNRENIVKALENTSPLLLNLIPLSLEEVFIYEIGGTGYEVDNILL